jgi:2'-5' RNA ligase
MRLFTAIDLPPEMLEKMREYLARLRPLAGLEWSAEENLHITTKFIGAWPEARVPEMKTALLGVKARGPIHVSVRGSGWFPSVRRPRVFWAGVEAGKPLARLAGATEAAVAKLGVPVETRVYTPHLTLARLKTPVELEDLLPAIGEPDFGAFDASSFFLYHSLNGEYSKLAEFPLIS